jgi:hypothetical protein
MSYDDLVLRFGAHHHSSGLRVARQLFELRYGARLDAHLTTLNAFRNLAVFDKSSNETTCCWDLSPYFLLCFDIGAMMTGADFFLGTCTGVKVPAKGGWQTRCLITWPVQFGFGWLRTGIPPDRFFSSHHHRQHWHTRPAVLRGVDACPRGAVRVAIQSAAFTGNRCVV